MDSGDSRAERLIGHSRALRSDMRELANDVAEVGRDLQQKLDFSRSIQEHPFRTVFIAAGVGYLLGGGLFTPLTARALRVGGRAMLLPILRSQLEAMVAGGEQARREQARRD